jgi:hypothetical protein
MIQGTKYVDAFPSHGGGRLLPNERRKGYTLSSKLVHSRKLMNRTNKLSNLTKAAAAIRYT